MRRGTHPFQKKAPLTPGYCLVGGVHANGADFKKFQRQDLVACLGRTEVQIDSKRFSTCSRLASFCFDQIGLSTRRHPGSPSRMGEGSWNGSVVIKVQK
jgi:hypothetical protein